MPPRMSVPATVRRSADLQFTGFNYVPAMQCRQVQRRSCEGHVPDRRMSMARPALAVAPAVKSSRRMADACPSDRPNGISWTSAHEQAAQDERLV